MSESATSTGVSRSPNMGAGRRLWRVLRLGVTAALMMLVMMTGAGWWWIASLGPVPRGEGLAYSTLVVDRDGRLLRPYTTPEGRWRLPATRDDVDPRFLAMLYAYEDRRFLSHHGVDPLALGRAASQLIANGRIVSGASTLTMQVARLLEPRSERSFVAKLRQLVRAIQLERALGKDQILALYFSLAPYGGNLEGIRAASLSYFGKEPRRLSLAESALLVALPQAPELRRPDRSVRCRVVRASRIPRWSSIAMDGCCGPTPRRRAAGGCRRRARMSTRASWQCCSPTRIAASSTIAVSIRWRSRAPYRNWL